MCPCHTDFVHECRIYWLYTLHPVLDFMQWECTDHWKRSQEDSFLNFFFYKFSVNRAFNLDFKLCGSEDCLFFMLKSKERRRFSFLTAVEDNCEGRIERLPAFPEYQLYTAHIPGRGCFPPRGVYSLNFRRFTALKGKSAVYRQHLILNHSKIISQKPKKA